MTNELLNAILQDIIENPFDDVPRLIYADALEDRNGPEDKERADLIRLQIEYKNLQSDECACGFVPTLVCDVCRLRTAIFAIHGDKSLKFLMEPRKAKYRFFERGMVNAISVHSHTWMNRGRKLVKEHPLTLVILYDKHPTRSEEDEDGFVYPAEFGWNMSTAFSQNSHPAYVPQWLKKYFYSSELKMAKGTRSYDAAMTRLSVACLKWARQDISGNIPPFTVYSKAYKVKR